MLLIHATCVAIGGRGVLLRGPSGIGKSDVALRLMDRGAVLVSDDQVALRLAEGRLSASPPETLAGGMEVRGVGLLRFPFLSDVPVFLCVDLVGEGEKMDRLPAPDTVSFLDQPIKALKLPGYAASTPAVIRAALDGVFWNEREQGASEHV